MNSYIYFAVFNEQFTDVGMKCFGYRFDSESQKPKRIFLVLSCATLLSKLEASKLSILFFNDSP